MGRFRASSSPTSKQPYLLDIPRANAPFLFSQGLLQSYYVKVDSSASSASASEKRRELNSRNWDLADDRQQQQQQEQQYVSGGSTGGVGERVFGLKTSAAFFASLRSNLRLPLSPLPSPLSTPPSMRASTTSLPPPSPLSAATDFITMDESQQEPSPNSSGTSQPPTTTAATISSLDPLSNIPPLHTHPATTSSDRVSALKLIADSIAQQRQQANTALLSHPLNISLAIGFLSFLARYMSLSQGYDYLAVGMTCSGALMTALVSLRFFTQSYLSAAEEINWAWLGDGELLVTKFGEEVIGVVVLEWLSGEPKGPKRKKVWRGEIRAWTVKMRYRGKGVGTALLEEAVGEARRRGSEGLEFAEGHANSRRFLPSLYNRGFDKREQKARALLQSLNEAGGSGPGRGTRRKRAGSSG